MRKRDPIDTALEMAMLLLLLMGATVLVLAIGEIVMRILGCT